MKGPVAVAVPAVVLLPLWWLERGAARPRWTGILAATAAGALVGLPWYVAMFATHGVPYLESFFLDRQPGTLHDVPLQRAATAVVLSGGASPAAWCRGPFFAVGPTAGALTDAVKRRLTLSREERRLCVWAAAPLLLFMASVGQQPRYVLPVLPPLAILLAAALEHRVRDSSRSLVWPTWATAGAAAPAGGPRAAHAPGTDVRGTVGAMGGRAHPRQLGGGPRIRRDLEAMVGAARNHGVHSGRGAARRAIRRAGRPAPRASRAGGAGRARSEGHGRKGRILSRPRAQPGLLHRPAAGGSLRRDRGRALSAVPRPRPAGGKAKRPRPTRTTCRRRRRTSWRVLHT